MTKEYEMIREALIALLCVNDKVYYIHRWNGFNIIRKSYVTSILPNIGITIQNRYTINTNCSFGSMEHNEGKLYIWDDIGQMRRKKKIENMMEILKSDATTFE
jgi:hypothetical protein